MKSTRQWPAVALLSVGIAIAYLDRTNMSIALASTEFRRTFALSEFDRGLINSAFFCSYALLQIPAGMLVDRYSVRVLYAISFAGWSLLSASTAWLSSVAELIVIRILLGVAESVATPASLRWINDHIGEEHRGLAIGSFQAGTKVGSAVGAPLAVWLLMRFSWRVMFVVMGAGCLIWLVPWLHLVRDDGSGPARNASRVPIRRLFKSHIIWGVVIGTFCYSYFAYFCVTWLPSYFVERRGLSMAAMSFYSFVSFASLAIMTPLAGWAADRIISYGKDPIVVRKSFIILGFLFGSTEIVGAHTQSRDLALFFAVFSLGALGLASANYWALTQVLVPADAIGSAAGIQNCASNTAGFLSPLIAGWLIQSTGSYETAMKAIWLVLICGVLAYLILIPRNCSELSEA